MLTDILTSLLQSHDLPDPLPSEPMPLLAEWLDQAERSGRYEDPNAMVLATCNAAGEPSARVVLCKNLDPRAGTLTFYTSYLSRKARDLEDNPRAACVFHWPHARRQARVEGVVRRLSDAESQAYFRTRPLLARLGACVSRQSEPIASYRGLIEDALRLAARAALGESIERPDSWGGFRLFATGVELWSARTGRLHQRVLWTRPAPSAGESPASSWSSAWLAP